MLGRLAPRGAAPAAGRGALVLTALLAGVVACGDGGDGGGGSAASTGKPGAARTGDRRPDPVRPVATGAVTALPPAEPHTPPAARGRVTYEEAETAYRDRRYDEAVELFSAYAERRPENAWGHYMLGLSAWKAGLPERAIPSFERALELRPDHLKSLVNLSRVRLETGRAEEAVERIERALDLDPGSADAWRVAGNVYADLGRAEDAMQSYRRAIALDDRDAWAMNNLGLVLLRQGRFQEALGPLARASELRPEVGVFHNNLGVALERTGHLAAAADAYRAAVGSEEGSERAARSLARVEEVGFDRDAGSVDLAGVAAEFLERVHAWRAEAPAPPDTGPPGDDAGGEGTTAVPERGETDAAG